MRNWCSILVAAVVTVALPQLSPGQVCEHGAGSGGCSTDGMRAKKLGGQVFFRFGGGFLTEGSRAGQVFTDTLGGAGRNDGTGGIDLGFGLNLPLMKDAWNNTLLAEVALEYAKFSQKRVLQTTSALLGGQNTSEIAVSELSIMAAPKYRFELGKVRPWVIPVGLEFLVQSPPTNDTTYLDVGIPFALGVDYMLTDDLSVGVDWRYHLNLNISNATSGDFTSVAGYIGFNF